MTIRPAYLSTVNARGWGFGGRGGEVQNEVFRSSTTLFLNIVPPPRQMIVRSLIACKPPDGSTSGSEASFQVELRERRGIDIRRAIVIVNHAFGVVGRGSPTLTL